MRYAARLDRMSNENAFTVLAQVNRLRGEGRDIVSFCIGEPDFPTPEHICEAGIDAIRRGETKYVPAGGTPRFREIVARHVSETRGIHVTAENVVITPGVKPALFAAALATVSEGDEVIYPNPGFPIYRSHIEFLGGKAVPLPLREEREFRFDVAELEKRITPKTTMIMLNSPQNPTGGVLTIDDLHAIADIAKAHDLWVLSDDIYREICYDGAAPSIISLPGMLERTLLVDGHSKFYSMTGWRLGYIVCNRELAERLPTLMVNMISCTAPFTQQAGAVALESTQEPSRKMVQEFGRRRDLIVAGLNAIDGISCLLPRGAFYVFPNVTGACRKVGLKDAVELQEYLLDKVGVAVLARSCFGPKNEGEDQEYVRLSYATSEEAIREGLRRIQAAVERP